MSAVPRAFDPPRVRFYDEVGHCLRTMREAAGLSRQRVADHVRINVTQMERIEEGLMECPLHVAARFSELVDCTIDEVAPVMMDERGDA